MMSKTYLIRIAYSNFEVNTEIEVSNNLNASKEELLHLALTKLESNGFSCSQESPTVEDMEYEEV